MCGYGDDVVHRLYNAASNRICNRILLYFDAITLIYRKSGRTVVCRMAIAFIVLSPRFFSLPSVFRCLRLR